MRVVSCATVAMVICGIWSSQTGNRHVGMVAAALAVVVLVGTAMHAYRRRRRRGGLWPLAHERDDGPSERG